VTRPSDSHDRFRVPVNQILSGNISGYGGHTGDYLVSADGDPVCTDLEYLKTNEIVNSFFSDQKRHYAGEEI
jgi:hypothetical protein